MLTQDVQNVGQAGDIREVADGYGRNFLVPRRLAIVAGRGTEGEARRLREAATKREAKEREIARELAEEIGNKTVVVRLKVGADDRAFGAVTSEDIAVALLRQHQVEIDRRKIELREPIKQLGEHVIPLRLHRDVDANINLIVTQDR
ncbi:MAG: 50S ribosomal protein L9 [Candidatus Dormibacteraeota bacterium]|nr:50S ribosomal protein L9 [Candidatus Dormibacteraeota bacterium]